MHVPRPSYASVIATIALFAALGGTSYAALTVSGKNIRNGTVTSADLKNESIESRDVDNGSLTGSDLKTGSVTGSDVDDGSLRAADFKSGELPAGPAGPQGPPGATTVVTRRAEATVPDDEFEVRAVSCSSGQTVVGGGASITGDGALILENAPIEADGSRPEDGDSATGWSARGGNATGSPQTLNVYVLCATP
jgi:hypothetical protein